MSYGNYYHHPTYINYPYSYVFQPSSSFIAEEELEDILEGDSNEQQKNNEPFLPHIDSHKHYYYGYDDDFYDDDDYLLINKNNHTHLPFGKNKKINKTPKRSKTLYLPYIRSTTSFQHIWREPKNLIEENNQYLHKRLLKVKPVISSAELERDWKRHKQFSKLASRFHKCNLVESSPSLRKRKINKT